MHSALDGMLVARAGRDSVAERSDGALQPDPRVCRQASPPLAGPRPLAPISVQVDGLLEADAQPAADRGRARALAIIGDNAVTLGDTTGHVLDVDLATRASAGG
jgi:hypothetical protein